MSLAVSPGGVSEGLSERDLFPGITGTTLDYEDTISGHVEIRRLELLLRGHKLIIEGEEPYIDWYRPICEDLLRLLDLNPNWDSYGASQVEVQSVEIALDILGKVADFNTPRPSIVPTVHGGIQLEWHMSGIDLEIEVDPGAQGSFYYEDRTGGATERRGDPRTESSLLQELIGRLGN